MYRFYEVSTVALILRENQKSFYVHLDLLCDTSPFFKAAFTKNFKETFEKEMSLPEDDESIFELALTAETLEELRRVRDF